MLGHRIYTGVSSLGYICGPVRRRATPFVCSFKASLQLAQQIGRRRSIGGDPALVNALNRANIEIIPAATPFFSTDNQPRLLKNSEMLHHGGSIEMRQVLANVAGGHRRVPQKIQNSSAISAG